MTQLSLKPNSILPSIFLLMIMGCKNESTELDKMIIYGEQYTAAWNSLKQEKVALFYAEDGLLTVNNGKPNIGRDQVANFAGSFMTSFPDMKLTMDSMVVKAKSYRYHWTFVGTNSGPEGTGNKVKFSGFEEWTLNEKGLIQKSIGTFDAEDYQRQVNGPLK